LHSSFKIWVNDKQLESSKLRLEPIDIYIVGGSDDEVAKALHLSTTEAGVVIPGLSGTVSGVATIYKKRLTEGKSDQYSRSHGFFVRVRERVINLEDELFGLAALNHAAWSRFSMEVYADGLREHLLSSREGVRESDPIRLLREYLHGVFNYCRRAYAADQEKQQNGLDLDRLLNDAPSGIVVDPLIDGVRRAAETDQESYYVGKPDLPDGTSHHDWMISFSAEASAKPFGEVLFEGTGLYDRVVRYLPETRTLMINIDHPFIAKLIATGKTRAPAAYFGSAELLVDLLLQDHGFTREQIIDFLGDRDRVLRLVAGEEPSTASQVLHMLAHSTRNEKALERAVGLAFRVLGFEYERRGGNKAGPDGILYARLGRGIASLADYKVVYDSKQTNSPSVAADKVKVDSLEDFRESESADFGFFVAAAYDAQDDPNGKLNREVAAAALRKAPISLLRVDDLRRLVELHYRYGVTLTRLRSLFETAHTVPQVRAWVDGLERELEELEPQVPLQLLLEQLERAKDDDKARPNVYSVRIMNERLKTFTPPKLIASLKAVETIIGKRWIEVENSGDVLLHHTAGQVLAEMERQLRDLLGADALERRPIQ